ncbi:MAG: hypothetical protein LBE12_10235 [Planctomycetaceae bacterium]|jgi:hypothetical protein|nr:hypothetical protein [Planctomycetaceae bacterium]
MKTFIRLFSFGNRYVSATFLYLGLGFILFAITPELPQSFAQCDSCGNGCGGEEGCPDGLVCQDGECVCPDN